MNNKKNKSKSRGKPNKTTQEENKDNIEIVESESLNTDETRVPEIVTESNIIIESDQLINDVPKKPKRSKGKKKKESLFEDIKTKQENNETKDINDVSENVENITEENIPITPCVRKKKKKVKKQDENSKNNIECHNETVLKCTDKDFDKEKCIKLETEESVSVSMQILSQNVNVAHKDDAPCKKKKKKKHRHDSEKSDAHDPCTLAFQKLIEPLETPNEADNDDNSKDIQKVKDEEKNVAELMEVPLINPNQVSKEIKSPESTITEKLNIDKKHPPKNISEKLEKATAEKIILSTSQENISLLENSENTTVIKETSPKPKAKIVKPVQKKRRNKSESESVKTLIDHNHDVNTSKNIDIMISNPEEMLQKTNFTGNESQNTVLKEVITVSSIPGVLNSDTKNIQAIEIGQCQSIKQDSVDSSELKNMSENKQERETSPKNYDDLGFVEVKTSKGKKKRDKAVKGDAYKTTEIISDDIGKEKDTLNLDMKNKSEIKCEELETQKIIIPDLIEYPRSTSEQYVDSNNNTYIQEITPTDEVKIDIPIYTSTPIIEGSGESPESQIRNNPIIINVTEINPQPSSSKEKILQSEKDQTSEKTDIKSKMIEVNRDMEELRRSIERSLAELTSVEKNDTEVDKEFEELFQSQTAEQPSTDITPNKIFNPESSINISDEKCCIEDVRNSARTHEINKNIELKVTENVKTEYKNFDDNNLSSEANLNVSLVSDHNESKKSTTDAQNVAPVCPARRDKSKNKSKKKGKKDVTTNSNSNTSVMHDTQTTSAEKDSNQKSEKSEQKSEKSEQKSETTQEKGKQQTQDDEKYTQQSQKDIHFEPIDNFEDALTSSVDDINQTFEIIAKDAAQALDPDPKYQNNPQINIISPAEDSEGENKQDKNKIEKKQNPVSRPKNLLGYPNIPVSSNKTDFKKEKSKPPNTIQAKVKIKDSVEIEKATNKETLIENKRKLIKDYNGVDSTYRMKENEDLVYKYSFRKVFLQSTCHVCKKDLVHRVPCKFCSLVFYCSQKHKDEDWSQHQSLCFAVCTIAHLKEQKHIYADAQNILGHHYRVLRMQTILSCEKILNRKLMPWEQEAILYPRICNDVKCRQWKQGQLKDCAGCGQISYCIDHPDHLSSSHQRWCNSYALYQRLVKYQLTKGRLEPPLPTKVLNHYQMPEKINDVLGSMYEEKIDMDDIQYAALTQIATAPLTAAYSYQLHSSKMHSTGANGIRKSSTFTIHIIGAELPFEADSLNKWEIFFLHLRSDVQDLRVVMVGPDINSSKLPLDLLAKIKLCENCQTNKRRVLFDFHDNESYHEYYLSDAFVTPDIVCAFNPNIHRSSAYNIETWPSTINSILKQRVPFVLTSYSIEELRRDVGKVREWARVDFNVVSEIKYNPYSSVRPDRNFITDHEIPLLFKNYCFCILCGTL